jgi:Domain of unknown function (DUF4260)
MRMSLPAALLRLEGLVVLGAALALYVDGAYAIWALIVFFLAPDLSFAATRAGHAWVLACTTPLTRTSALSRSGLRVQSPAAGCVCSHRRRAARADRADLAAHIGADRLLGFGLKYSTGFGDTHLGSV